MEGGNQAVIEYKSRVLDKQLNNKVVKFKGSVTSTMYNTSTKRPRVRFTRIIAHLTLQNLVEEVKLMQHALQKYKMEFKALQIRANGVYRENLEILSAEERYDSLVCFYCLKN